MGVPRPALLLGRGKGPHRGWGTTRPPFGLRRLDPADLSFSPLSDPSSPSVPPLCRISTSSSSKLSLCTHLLLLLLLLFFSSPHPYPLALRHRTSLLFSILPLTRRPHP